MLVELAQNAADAARRAGAPGRLLLRLDVDRLTAANTGAGLDAEGVQSLSTLRASAKRDDDAGTVGRYGVGFAAVLAVTDEPMLASRTGAVRWSRTETFDVVRALPSLTDELTRRSSRVPVLRLPWPAVGAPPDGYDSAVVLPLRDQPAHELLRGLLAELDDALLLALPALDEIVIESGDGHRTLHGTDRWHVVRRSGTTDPELLLDRPTEERAGATWSLLWARPTAGQPVPPCLHAPTPTDEPLDLPALLVATFPLDPARRHVAPGPLTDFLVAQAGKAYAELAAATDEPLALVPGPVPAGALDAALRQASLRSLADAPLLPGADGALVRPRDAASVVGLGAADPLFAVLSDVIPDLVADSRALERLGGRRLPLADVVDQLAEVGRGPEWWWGLYDALAPTVAYQGEELGALPVPLADGRLVRGPRGVLLPGGALPKGLGVLGVRLVHPDAAHPVLLRLGAVEATARSLLEDPAVRGAVLDLESSQQVAEEDEGIADAILALVSAAALEPGELPWLGGLLLRDDRGGTEPAEDLALADGLVAQVGFADAFGRPDPQLVDRWGRDVLAGVGVADGLPLVAAVDLLIGEESDHGLPDEAGWHAAVVAALPRQELPPLLPEFVALNDLDVVRPDAWPVALAAIAAHPRWRSAVVEPSRVVLADGSRADVPSYTAWWLRVHAQLDGRRPDEYVSAAAGPLAALYAELASPLDDEFLAAIGVRSSLGRLLAEPGGPDELLDRLADPDVAVAADQLAEMYEVIARVEPDRVTPPDRIRVTGDLVVDGGDVVVIEAPYHLQLPWSVPPLVVPLDVAAPLAAVLDVDTSGQRLDHLRIPGGTETRVPDVAAQVAEEVPATWHEHDRIRIGDHDVDWWVDAADVVHACTLDGLARGLVWAAGRWELRFLMAAVLAEPDRAEQLLAEARLDRRR